MSENNEIIEARGGFNTLSERLTKENNEIIEARGGLSSLSERLTKENNEIIEARGGLSSLSERLTKENNEIIEARGGLSSLSERLTKENNEIIEARGGLSSLSERLNINHGEATHWVYKLKTPAFSMDPVKNIYKFTYVEIVAKVDNKIIKLPAGELPLLYSSRLAQLIKKKKDQYPGASEENLKIDQINLIISLGERGLEVDYEPFCKCDEVYFFGKKIDALPNEEPHEPKRALPSNEATSNNVFIAGCPLKIEEYDKSDKNGQPYYNFKAKISTRWLAKTNRHVFGAIAKGQYYLHLEAALKAIKGSNKRGSISNERINLIENKGSILDIYPIIGSYLKLEMIQDLAYVTINANHAEIGPTVAYNPENDVHNQWHFDDMEFQDFPILKLRNLENVTINDLCTPRIMLKDVDGLRLTLTTQRWRKDTQVISFNDNVTYHNNTGVVLTQNDLPRKLTVLDTEQADNRYEIKENNYDSLAVHARDGKTDIIFGMADSACPLGSLKAFAENDAINEKLLAKWIECEEDDEGAHWFSAETVSACEQVIGEENSFYRLQNQNFLLKWAECDGTFPLPVPGGSNKSSKPKLIPNLNGNENEEVFLAGSVNTNRFSYNSEMLTDNAGFSARNGHQAVVFKNEMYIIGGYDYNEYKNDVWKSTDGENWKQEYPESEIFSTRTGHEAVVFKGAIYVIGGWGNDYENDVWKSADGKKWTQETSNARFSARAGHQAVVFKDEMYVIGGYDYNGAGNDVWKSTDGENWEELATSNSIFSAREVHQAVVFKDAMYVIGGYDGSRTNDVWKSTDGKNWEDVTPTNLIFSPRHYHQAVVFNGAMYVIGGSGNGYKNDVWKSTDGFTWTQEDPIGEIFSPRSSHQAVVYNGAIYISGGYSEGVADRRYKNDVWTIQEENKPVVSNNFKAITIDELPAHTHDMSHSHSASCSSGGVHTHSTSSDGSHTHGYSSNYPDKDVGNKLTHIKNYEAIEETPLDAKGTNFPAEKSFLHHDGEHSHRVNANGNHNHRITIDRESGNTGRVGGAQPLDMRPRHVPVKYYMRVQ